MATFETPSLTSDSRVEEIRETFTWMENEWADIRTEADIDMRYVAGDGWDPKDKLKRELAGRPCVWFDELGQYSNQLINDARANPRAVKFDPVGGGADEASARFFADKMREIEYRSRAKIAYTTALENSTWRGFGWVRVATRYGTSDNQEIWIDAVPNPNTILPDPEAKRPDNADMKRLIVFEEWRQRDFKKKFKDARIHDFSSFAAQAPGWVGGEMIRLAEYWSIETKARNKILLQMPAPQAMGSMLGLAQAPAPQWVFEDEITTRPDGATVLKERKVDVTYVTMDLCNGMEILEHTDWPGKWIPFASCFGKVMYVDEKRVIHSQTRAARGPAMTHSYARTGEIEVLGMIPKFPYFVRKGSLDVTNKDLLQKANTEPVAFIEVENHVEGRLSNDPPEFPQRQPWDPPIEKYELAAESARRGIQAAMGISPLPTDAQRQNQKSGVALKRIESSGQRGSYHFIDGNDGLIWRVGEICEDLITHIYDTAQDTGVRRANDTTETIRINDPGFVDKKGEKAPSTAGDHQVSISTGPSFETERDAASDFADTLAGNPQVFPLIGPLVVKLKNLGPIGDEIAKALEFLQPPQMRAEQQAEKNGPPGPEQIAQMQMQLQQLEQKLGEASKFIETEQAKQQATIEKARMDGELQVKLQEMRNAATIRVAMIAAQVKGAQIQSQENIEAIALAHESAEAHRDRVSSAMMGERAHEQGLEASALSADVQAGEAERERASAASAAELERAHAAEMAAQQPPTV